MKKKRFVGLLSLLAFASVVTSCGVSSSTPATSGTSVSSSSPAPEQSTTTPAEETEKYVTETLKNGFAIPTSIPDKKGTITKEKAKEALAMVSALFTDTAQDEILDLLVDGALPFLIQGGWTDADADKLMDICNAEAFKTGVKDFSEFWETQNFEKLYAAIPNFYLSLKSLFEAFDTDKFASVFAGGMVGVFSGLAPKQTHETTIRPFGVNTMATVLAQATGPVKTYFEKVAANSRDGAALVEAFVSSPEYEMACWTAGWTAYGILSAIVKNFTAEELTEITKFTMGVLTGQQTDGAPTTAEMAKMARLAGRLLDKCLMDREGLKNLLTQTPSVLFGGMDAYANPMDYAFSLTKYDAEWFAENVTARSDAIFNTVKYLALLLENVTEETVGTVVKLFQTLASGSGEVAAPTNPDVLAEGGEQTEAPDVVPDVVVLLKAAFENLTRFGADAEEVLDSIKSVAELTVNLLNAPTAPKTAGGSTTSFGFLDIELSLDDAKVDQLIEQARKVSALDSKNLTEDDRTLVSQLLSLASEAFVQKTTSYDVQMDGPMYEVGQKVGDIAVTVTENPSTDEAKETNQTIPATDIKNLSTESPRFNVASVEIGDYNLTWNYTVSNYAAQLEKAEVLDENGNVMSESRPGEGFGPIFADEAFQFICIFKDGKRQEVDQKDIVNLNVSPDSSSMIFVPLGEGEGTEYVPFYITFR